MKLISLLTSAFALIVTAHGFALEVPALTGRVNDYADMISPAAESALETNLKSFEESDSTQVVILTINSLEGDALEDFSIRVAEKWKIGQTKKDNGVIFLAVKNDRLMRIEVGRGLEGVLTDLLAGRIIDNVVRPRFKAGDFDGGFISGAGAIIEASRGEFKNDGPPAGSGSDDSSGYLIFILFGLYFVINIVSGFSKILGGVIGAAALPGLIHFAVIPLGLFGILAGAAAGFILSLVLPYLPIGGGGRSGGGSWGSSGGGFSGGGGSFGGGGASGGW